MFSVKEIEGREIQCIGDRLFLSEKGRADSMLYPFCNKYVIIAYCIEIKFVDFVFYLYIHFQEENVYIMF